MLLALSPAERVRMSSSMFDTARAVILATLPPGSPAEIRVGLFRRLYGADFDSETRNRIEEHLRRSSPDG